MMIRRFHYFTGGSNFANNLRAINEPIAPPTTTAIKLNGNRESASIMPTMGLIMPINTPVTAPMTAPASLLFDKLNSALKAKLRATPI